MNCDTKVWAETLARLEEEIPDFAYSAWVAPLVAKISPTRIVLGCPSSFHRDRVRIQYLDELERHLALALKYAAQDADSTAEKSRETSSKESVSIEVLTLAEFAERPGHVFSSTAPLAAARTDSIDAKRMHSVREATHDMALAAEGGGARSPVPSVSPAAQSTQCLANRQNPSGATAHSSTSTRPLSLPLSPGSSSSAPSFAPSFAPSSAPSSATDPSPESNETKRARLHAVPERRRVTTSGARVAVKHSRSPQDKPRTQNVEPAQGELPFSFESFIVGPCNALAREAALALARRRQESLNLLYLAGESGMGKTHLARATASEARRQGRELGTGKSATGAFARRSGGILYTTAEQFTSEFVSAMRGGRSEEFKRRYRSPIDLLVVEDIQSFSGRIKTQLELFHTVSHVLDAGGRVLLTGDRSPRELSDLDEKMRAQVAQGFVAELDSPDAIVRRHILRKKADAGGLRLPDDCLDFLVDATRGSVRDIESMLIQVVTTASLLGKPIDLALTQDAVSVKTSASSIVSTRTVAVSEIVKVVAGFFGKRPEALAAKSRRRDVLVPRQLAMYLAHQYCDASFAEIGRALGRGHPSVRNAVERIQSQVVENAPMRYQLEALSERIDQSLGLR